MCTIDGNNTLHVMGIMATITPSPEIVPKLVIPRKIVSSQELKGAGAIKILQYHVKPSALSKVVYGVLQTEFTESRHESADLNLLWLSSWFFKNLSTRPGWNGSMQMAFAGRRHPGKASIIFWPFIDLPASNETCLYSAGKPFPELFAPIC